MQEEEREPENALEILERKGCQQGEIEVCSYFISGMAQAKELLNDLNKLWLTLLYTQYAISWMSFWVGIGSTLPLLLGLVSHCHPCI